MADSTPLSEKVKITRKTLIVRPPTNRFKFGYAEMLWRFGLEDGTSQEIGPWANLKDRAHIISAIAQLRIEQTPFEIEYQGGLGNVD